MRIREIAKSRVRYGYRKIRVLLNREGWKVGKILVYRLYKEEGLALTEAASSGEELRSTAGALSSTAPNQAGVSTSWPINCGWTRFRALTIVDVYTRESLAIEAGQSLKGEDVVRVLNRIKTATWSAEFLFCDNGQRVHQSSHGPMGLPERSEDRLLPSWEADRQCLRGIVQWDLPSRMSECPLVRDPGRSQTADRGMAARIQ